MLVCEWRILTVTLQVDPREKLDPDVEDVLLEIADDFVETVSIFVLNHELIQQSRLSFDRMNLGNVIWYLNQDFLCGNLQSLSC
jgi:hypothetical protein